MLPVAAAVSARGAQIQRLGVDEGIITRVAAMLQYLNPLGFLQYRGAKQAPAFEQVHIFGCFVGCQRDKGLADANALYFLQPLDEIGQIQRVDTHGNNEMKLSRREVKGHDAFTQNRILPTI